MYNVESAMCRYIFGSLKNPFETALLKILNDKREISPSRIPNQVRFRCGHWLFFGFTDWDPSSGMTLVFSSPIWPLRLNLSETYLYRILRIAGAFAVRLYCAIKHMHFQTFNPSKFGSGVLDMVRKRELTKPKKLSFTLQIPPVQKDISNMKFPMHGMQF